MAFIFLMSADSGSANHSSFIIGPVILWANPSASPEQFEIVHLLFRKICHFSEYAVLGVLILRALRSSGWRVTQLDPAVSLRLVALCLASAYAASDEFHQTFIPGRSPSVFDVLIDTAGAAFGLIVTRLNRLVSRAPGRLLRRS